MSAAERQEGNLFVFGQLVVDIGLEIVYENGAQGVVKVADFAQGMVLEVDLVFERLQCDGRQAVGPELNVCVLVGLDVAEQHVGKVQDLLVRSVVYLEFECCEYAGTFEYVNCPGVRGTEFEERLTAILCARFCLLTISSGS